MAEVRVSTNSSSSFRLLAQGDFGEIESNIIKPLVFLDIQMRDMDGFEVLEKGKKSLTAVMNANKPYLKDKNLHFDLPNHLMKDQLERGKHPLLKFIREQLNNFKVDLILHVNEEETKKFAYTPQEKYEKLKEKNPAIDLLRKTFDLDL